MEDKKNDRGMTGDTEETFDGKERFQKGFSPLFYLSYNSKVRKSWPFKEEENLLGQSKSSRKAWSPEGGQWTAEIERGPPPALVQG